MWLNAAHIYCNVQGIDTCALGFFYISSAKIDDITLSMEMLRNQQKKWKKMCDLMMNKHPLVPGCVHTRTCPSLGCASDSIWDRHLRGEQWCIIMSFSKSDSDFNYSTEKKRIWIWNWYTILPDDSKVAEIHNFICFPMHMFFFNLDLTVLQHWHSCVKFPKEMPFSPQ